MCFFPFLACRCSNDTNHPWGFPATLVCVGGQVGHQSSLNNSPGSARIELRPHEPRLVLVVAVLWCDFGAVCLWWWAFVVFLALWRAFALYRVTI